MVVQVLKKRHLGPKWGQDVVFGHSLVQYAYGIIVSRLLVSFLDIG